LAFGADRSIRAAHFPHLRAQSALRFQPLASVKSPISPLNRDFLHFVAFCVPEALRDQ